MVANQDSMEIFTFKSWSNLHLTLKTWSEINIFQLAKLVVNSSFSNLVWTTNLTNPQSPIFISFSSPEPTRTCGHQSQKSCDTGCCEGIEVEPEPFLRRRGSSVQHPTSRSIFKSKKIDCSWMQKPSRICHVICNVYIYNICMCMFYLYMRYVYTYILWISTIHVHWAFDHLWRHEHAKEKRKSIFRCA